MPFPQDPPPAHAPKDATAKPTVKQESHGDNSPNIYTGDNSTINIGAPDRGWKLLTVDEAHKAFPPLAQFAGSKIEISEWGGEQTRVDTAKQIATAITELSHWTLVNFATGGWLFGDGKTGYRFPMEGIVLRVKSNTPQVEALSKALAGVYGKENVNVSVESDFYLTDTVQLYVWVKKRTR